MGVYVIYETFPAEVMEVDPITLATVAGPISTGTGSVGLASWEEGGAEIDGVEYIPYHSGTTDAATMKLRVHPSDLSTASTETDTTIPFIKGSGPSGSNSICAANGLLYALCPTGRRNFTWFGTLHLLDTLQIVEFQPDGTVTNAWDFPVTATWFSHDAPGFYQYPGEDSTSIPCIAITQDGATVYTTAMVPRPDLGDNDWEQGIFKCDVATGTITQLITDTDLFTAIQDFITTNWPEEVSPNTWDPYGFSGMACFPNGDLLVASNYVPLLTRIDSDGNVKQLFVGQNTPNNPLTEPPYGPWVGLAYTGVTSLCIDGTHAFTTFGNGGEVHVDDGLSDQSYVYPDPNGPEWLIKWDVSANPATTPVVMFPDNWGLRSSPDFLLLPERGYSVWASTPTEGGGPVLVVRDVADDAPAVDSVIRSVWRPTGELISNPVKLTIKSPVPITPPPSPEPVSPLPPPVFTPATMKKPRRETTIRPPGRRVRENTWASDVPVSRPTPPDRTVLKDMGGFGFTSGGLAHNINDEQVDEIFTPTFAPPPTRQED